VAHKCCAPAGAEAFSRNFCSAQENTLHEVKARVSFISPPPHAVTVAGSSFTSKCSLTLKCQMAIAKPLSRYAPFRRAGDLVLFAGITAADPATARVITGYADLPVDARKLAGESGEMSTDMKEGPIAAQSWYVLNALRQTVEAAGGTLDDVVKLTQYFRDLRDFPIYNRIRTTFFREPPASTVVQVSELLPTPDILLEVDATAYIPLQSSADRRSR